MARRRRRRHIVKVDSLAGGGGRILERLDQGLDLRDLFMSQVLGVSAAGLLGHQAEKPVQRRGGGADLRKAEALAGARERVNDVMDLNEGGEGFLGRWGRRY